MLISQVIVLPACAICMDEDEGILNIIVTKCGHIFHSHCLERWQRHEIDLREKNKCPLCNTRLQSHSHYPHEITSTWRLHQLTQRRVSILSEDDPGPEEKLKDLQIQIDSIKLDLEKESAKACAQEGGNAELITRNKALEITINRLRAESQSYHDEADEHDATLQQEKENHQKQCAEHQRKVEQLRNIASGLNEGQQRVKCEVEKLHSLLECKEIGRVRLSGLVASQSGTIRILEAQGANINQEKHQLHQMIEMTRERNKMPSERKSIESDRSHHLVNVMMALKDRFSKLESEYSSLKHMLETKDENERLDMSPNESAKNDPYPETLNTTLKNPLDETSVPIPQLSSQFNIDNGKQKIVERLIPEMNAVEVSKTDLDQRMDPRLFG